MVFKLIRVDIEEPSKIQLQVGKHIVGRGKFLHNDDTDKRVSRNHAELEVTDISVTLKALHQNPCFYIKSSTVDTEILQLNNTIDLSNGDKFGLIPDAFWYEVIHCSDVDVDTNATENVNNDNQVQNGTKIDVEEKIEECGNTVEEENNVTSSSADKEDEAIDFQISEILDDPHSSGSPSMLKPDESTQSYNVNIQSETSVPNTPNKRSHASHSDSPDNIKRVKTEPTTPGEQDVQPGPSNDQNASESDSKDQKPNIAAPASPQPPAALRERCMYGASCYRRNPAHKAQFSHPADADWGAGERGVCPYGGACRKPDARHWAAHRHPPGARRPDPAPVPRPGQGTNKNGSSGKRRTKRKANTSGSEDDSDDSPSSDLIVTGKRSRKTVQRDAWLDTQSDEEKDPYQTDESDEWKPSSDVTNSEGFSQNF